MRPISILAAALLATALGGCGGGGVAPAPPCALSGDSCTASGQCCSSVCAPDPLSPGAPGTCACAAAAGVPCATSDDCCESTYPTLACVNHACAAACRPDGDVCASDFSCCSGYCGPQGTCAEPCHGFGGPCTGSAECCTDLGCTGGTPGDAFCSWCAAASETCASDTDCCSGLDCRGSTCLAGTCSTQGQACSGDPECCAHLHCSGGACACGGLGRACGSTLDCCGGYVCGLDGVCHGESEPDGAGCIADRDCALGSCPGGWPADPAVCCQDAGTSCAPAGARCCAGDVCRGPADGSQACGACLTLLASTCYRTEECCGGNLCDAGRCCRPIAAPCAAAEECCNGLCDLYQNGAGGTPHCCGGAGASCRLDQPSTCCDGYQCYGTGGPGPEGACLAQAGSACRTVADCLDARWYGGVVCMPRDPATSGSPTVCSSWFDHPCSADVPCPSPLVCDATEGVCLVPAGESCVSPNSLCATGTECDGGTCCAPPATACDGPEDCCTGLCSGGACQCGGPKVHCAGPEHCCPGTHCEWQSTGTADYTCCAEERSACSTDSDCCPVPGGRLCDGVDHVCCRPAGASCSYTEWQQGLRCCDGTVCTRQSSGGYLTYACK